jgi:uncharacterized protein YcbK (DUF882 family)
MRVFAGVRPVAIACQLALPSVVRAESAHIVHAHVLPAHPAKSGQAGAGQEPPRAPKDSIHAVRLGEQFRIRAKDAHGGLPPVAMKSFERLMRQGEATHPPDPRLVALIRAVSNHFEGRTIEVVSGYRAYTPTQYTPHSNHNVGKALDFRVEGVKNEELWAFCRTLKKVGCGYYPKSTFVHLDVRSANASWIDRSRPGEPPMYDHPGVGADEGTSDVPEAAQGPRSGESTPPGSSSTQTGGTTGDSRN